MSKHPKDIPVAEWMDGWLILETASLLDTPGYVLMTEEYRQEREYPASREQRIAFIEARREADAFLLDPR